MKAIIEHLSELRVIPFATIDDPEKAIPLAQALLAGGSDVVSVSFQSPTAAESIHQIATAFPEMWVGAGSVTGVDEISAAHIAGARFALAPGFDPIVVDAALSPWWIAQYICTTPFPPAFCSLMFSTVPFSIVNVP